MVLECPVCRRAYDMGDRKPVTLSACGHGMCDECYLKPPKELSLQKGFPQPLRCPICRIENTKANLNARNENDDLKSVLQFFIKQGQDPSSALGTANAAIASMTTIASDQSDKASTVSGNSSKSKGSRASTVEAPTINPVIALRKHTLHNAVSPEMFCAIHMREICYRCTTCEEPYQSKCAECVMELCRDCNHRYDLFQTPLMQSQESLRSLLQMVLLQQKSVLMTIYGNLAGCLASHLETNDVVQDLKFLDELKLVERDITKALQIENVVQSNQVLKQLTARAKIESLDPADPFSPQMNDEDFKATFERCKDLLVSVHVAVDEPVKPVKPVKPDKSSKSLKKKK